MGEFTSAKRTHVEAREEWVCDGCGRKRPQGTRKVLVLEGSRVAAKLCVFCFARPSVLEDGSASKLVAELSEASDGDPFAVASGAEVWEEVFGARGDRAEIELSPERFTR